MLCRYIRFPMLGLWFMVAACTTVPRSDSLLKAPAPPHQKSTTAPSEHNPRLSTGEYAIMVESEPTGGVVVVNGIPVGRTPQQVVIAGTQRGFFQEQVSIKVRFLATDSEHTSQTIEEVLTPLDKIPASVRFTTDGATRVAR